MSIATNHIKDFLYKNRNKKRWKVKMKLADPSVFQHKRLKLNGKVKAFTEAYLLSQAGHGPQEWNFHPHPVSGY